MAQKKLAPRQKMINMMYIVLIALLALNVDRYVLDAFHLMEKNFTQSSESYNQKVASQMITFGNMLSKERSKTEPYYKAAKEAQKITSEFDSYISSLKEEIVQLYDGRIENEDTPSDLTPLKMPEGMEKHAYLFMVQEKGRRGKELQEKINTTRDQLLELLKPDKRKLFVSPTPFLMTKRSNLLHAEEPEYVAENRSWASIHLEYQPAGALLAMLTQYQNYAKA